MRLFIAVKPDKKTLDSLISLQRQFKSQGVYGNYTPVSNLHITLAFIGEYQYPKKVTDAVKTVPFSPFELSVKGVGHFGELYYADVCVSENMKTYVKELRAALDQAGIPYDKKNFTPHITLLRRASRPASAGITEAPVKMTADRVYIMRSDRTPSGMKYTDIGSAGHTE